MHPFLLNARALGLYLAAWLMVAVLMAAPLWAFRGVPALHALLLVGPLALVDGLICLSAFWVSRGNPLGKAHPARIAARLLSAALQASAMWVGFGALWTAWLRNASLFPLDRGEAFVGLGVLFVLGVPLYLMSLGAHYLILAFEASRAAERSALESQVTAREAELRALRAQLNPHFLFNSLNSINALVGSNPEGARHMCESLGDFLRRTLSLGARDQVTVAEELALIDRYFEIERVRFGARLSVETRIEPEAAGCLVPPLLLQPLVENAVKHGIADRVEGGAVRIAAAARDGILTLDVENDVEDGEPGRPGIGVGLRNVAQRLETLHAREARMDTRRADGRFRVTLTLPARRALGGGNAGH